MNVLFVHNNFPAQFRHLAAALAADERNAVAAIGSQTAQPIANVRLQKYFYERPSTVTTHPFARSFDLECRRAEQVLYAASALAADGLRPEVIAVHSGWGENLPLRHVFPNARIIVYCEFFYRAIGQDVDFDPEFPTLSLDGAVALQARNANALLALSEADDGLAPTRWQRSTFPTALQSKISVIHEGIDTRRIGPEPDAIFDLPTGKRLTRSDPVVTFVARDLEPLRGYHVFMRALPFVLASCPDAEVLIVGASGVSYGAHPPEGQTWKEVYLREVADRLDLARVHFLGRLPTETYRRVLQVSRVHVYMTYPFVLSWSLMEAMSTGCTIVASDTAPVQELIDETCGVLVPFLDVRELAEAVTDALDRPQVYAKLGLAARERIIREFDLQGVTIPSLTRFLLR